MGEQNLKEKAAKGIFWGGVSNGISQILGLVFGIFLARLLTPADYGMVGMLSIFTLIAGALQESGFVAALANKKVVRHEDYNAVFWFSLSTGIVLYVILFFCSPLIARYFGIPELVPLARYVFLCFLLSSLGTAHSAYLFRNLMVKQKAIITAFTCRQSGGIHKKALGWPPVSSDTTEGISTDHCHSAAHAAAPASQTPNRKTAIRLMFLLIIFRLFLAKYLNRSPSR